MSTAKRVRTVGKITVKSRAKTTAKDTESPPVRKIAPKSLDNLIKESYGDSHEWTGDTITRFIHVVRSMKNGEQMLQNMDYLFDLMDVAHKMAAGEGMVMDNFEIYIKSLPTNASMKDVIYHAPIFKSLHDKESLAAEIFLNRNKLREGAAKCRRCKGDQVNVYEKQTRSADEPMTITFKCKSCGYSWTE